MEYGSIEKPLHLKIMEIAGSELIIPKSTVYDNLQIL